MAAGLHLDNSRATQLAFALLLVLSATGRNSSSENLILYGAAGLVGWDLQKSQIHSITAPINPSPPSLQPRQTHHHSHASQVLSCSFKPAAPIRPGAQSAQTQNSSSAKPLPSKPARLQVWWAGVCRCNQDIQGHKLLKPQPTTCAAHTNSRFQQALPAPLPSLKPPCPTLSLTGASGEPPQRQ